MSDFDGSNVDENQWGSGPIPPGWYDFVILDAKEESTRKGGLFLKVQMSCLDPIYGGRPVTTRANTRNDNEKAVLIGRAEIKKMGLAALGRDSFNFSDLVAKKLAVKLKTVYSDHFQDDVNETADYGPLGYRGKHSQAGSADPLDVF